MKPIAIVQHDADVAPGNFEQHLQARGRSYVIKRLFDGDAMPRSAQPYAGICSLGGNMSVNDQLPWIEAELALLRDADARGVPVIGHCLGGQLLARAFGAVIDRSPQVEIGWGRLQIDDAERAREWFGESAADVEYFQWHEDAFGLPTGAHRLLRGDWCLNQAYVIERAGYAHIGMQFHIEMTAELVRLWASDTSAGGLVGAGGQCSGAPSLQSTAALLLDVELRIERMRDVAIKLYDRWLRGARD